MIECSNADVINSSRARCRSLGINLKAKQAPIVFQKKSNYLNLPRIRLIIEAASACLCSLEHRNDQFDHAITVTDEKGTIIYIKGTKNMLAEVRTYGLVVGGLWDERSMGNNAMGTALELNSPVSFVGDEHVVEIAKNYGCSAAPFYESDSGELMGCVNISCRAKDFHTSTMLAVMAISDSLQQRLKPSIQTCFDPQRLSGDRLTGTQRNCCAKYVNRSRQMRKIFSKAQRAALFDSTKMILGETGVGKEVLAKFIHESSPRREQKFIAVNCGAIPHELVESELFGYNGGSFTGAKRDGRFGKFERANGGTIFLDEIGEMPYNAQSKLLRIIEDKKLTRLGANRPIPLDVQIITSTNRDLKRMIQEKLFREDLYYRLKVAQFCIPPLRERPDDIPILVQYFLETIGVKLGMPVKTFSPEAMKALVSYHWPGNIRELKHIIEEACISSQSNIIDVGELNEDIPILQSHPPLDEKERIIAEIDRCKGNKSKAAKKLNISRVTLYRKMSKYGLSIKKGNEL